MMEIQIRLCALVGDYPNLRMLSSYMAGAVGFFQARVGTASLVKTSSQADPERRMAFKQSSLKPHSDL